MQCWCFYCVDIGTVKPTLMSHLLLMSLSEINKALVRFLSPKADENVNDSELLF